MESLPAVDWLTLDCVCILTNAVTAFRTSQDERDNDDRCGLICEIPNGAALTVCGGGFSKRTVRVRFGDCYYHVFWRDLASALISDQDKTTEEQAGLFRLAEVVGRQSHGEAFEMSSQLSTDLD
jgi:hypothetical protein